VRSVEGQLSGGTLRIAIVASRFNDAITSRLLDGALDCLRRHGVSAERIAVVRVPGAFEIPLAAKVLAESGEHDAIVCLGALIRGATPHFDVIVNQVTRGIAGIAAEAKLAVGFGVLTCDSIEQAIERSGSKGGNRGSDATMAAIEMANLYGALAGDSKGEAPAVAYAAKTRKK
jgi:6,7-dimethyl-8-ribityllumazine synthase